MYWDLDLSALDVRFNEYWYDNNISFYYPAGLAEVSISILIGSQLIIIQWYWHIVSCIISQSDHLTSKEESIYQIYELTRNGGLLGNKCDNEGC